MHKAVIPIMLWADFDPKPTIAQKIEKAARFYREKYSYVPNVVTLPADECFNETEVSVSLGADTIKLAVRKQSNVQPKHMTMTFEVQDGK